jgi:hypothetical protein
MNRYAMDRVGIAGVTTAAAVGWLLAAGGLAGTIGALPQLGWRRGVWVAALCGAPPSALWMTRWVIGERRLRAVVPPQVLARRYHGSLDAITDSEQRSLRPIAASAYDVAARTGELLAGLIAIPSVRIFHGVCPGGRGLPPIPHAISAGRQLLLVESVAWPPGRYETAADGGIHCDGTYIGQSVRPLLAAVQYWRGHLGRRYRVTAVIVVHTAAAGAVTLPQLTREDLILVCPEDAVRHIRRCILRGPQAVRRDLVAALIAATASRA